MTLDPLPFIKGGFSWLSQKVDRLGWERVSLEVAVVVAPILTIVGVLWKPDRAARVLSKMAVSTVDKISSSRRPFSDCLKIAVGFLGIHAALHMGSRFLQGQKQTLSSFSRIANLAIGCLSLHYALIKGNARAQLILGGTHHFLSGKIILAAGIALSSLGIFLRDVLVDVLVKDPDSKFDYYWDIAIDREACPENVRAHVFAKLAILARACVKSEAPQEREGDIKGWYKRALQKEQDRTQLSLAFKSYLEVFRIAQEKNLSHRLPIVREKIKQLAGLPDLYDPRLLEDGDDGDHIPVLALDLVRDRPIDEALIRQVRLVMPEGATPAVHEEIAREYKRGRIAEREAQRFRLANPSQPGLWANALIKAFGHYSGPVSGAAHLPLVSGLLVDRQAVILKELLSPEALSLAALRSLVSGWLPAERSSSLFLFDCPPAAAVTEASPVHRDLLVGLYLEGLALHPEEALSGVWDGRLEHIFTTPPQAGAPGITEDQTLQMNRLRRLFAAFLHTQRALSVANEKKFPIKEEIRRVLFRIIARWRGATREATCKGSRFELTDLCRAQIAGQLSDFCPTPRSASLERLLLCYHAGESILPNYAEYGREILHETLLK